MSPLLVRAARFAFLFAPVAVGVACGGTVTSSGTSSSSGGGGSSSSGGGSSSGGSSSGGSSSGGVRVPKNHRPAAAACTSPRATPTITPMSPGDKCTSHEECTAGRNGRCTQVPRLGTYECSYDACEVDTDCGGRGAVCACRVGVGQANICLAGNCRVDADCAGNYCSPSQGNCGAFGGNIGYFCHVAADECVDDSDCGTPASTCRFEPAVGHFKCSDSQCAG